MIDNVHFYLDTIWTLPQGCALIRNHEGAPYRCPDLPKGSVLGTDAQGNVFKHVMSNPKDLELINVSSKEWPKKGPSGIRLFRDYWAFVYNEREEQKAPYYASIAQALKKTLVK